MFATQLCPQLISASGSSINSASVAYGPGGQVLLVTFLDGSVLQVDVTGAHVLTGGVRSASVAFGPAGRVLDMIFQDNSMVQFDAFGVHPLGKL